MPRKPDTPCAGCETLLWSGRTSLPPGERFCHPCRRTGRGPVATRTCHCGVEFTPNDHSERKQLTCSVKCGQMTRCAKRALSTPPADPAVRLSRRRATYQRKNLRRRALSMGPILSIHEVAERDGWRCHLCRKIVRRDLAYPHLRSASRDHLIPVAAGGTNESSNLALAHWDCNVRRRTGGTVQLRLVG